MNILALIRARDGGSRGPLVAFFALILLLSPSLHAQSKPEAYKARLSPLGVTNATVATTTGVGAVTASLTGTKLTIEATFEGLTGMATAANLRRGPKGIPGPVVFDLEFPKASEGKITAALDLKPEQIEDLRAGRLYLQIHSERAPDGSIRGWLLK